MWGPDDRRDVCPACGDHVRRSAAREYDKDGDPWTRAGKTFEYFCPSCHDALCHHDRESLESVLVEINAGSCSDREFFDRYYRLVTEDTASSKSDSA